MRALLRDEPALVANIVSAIIGLALVLGVDPILGGAIGSLLTVAAGVWIRSSVYPQRAVTALVNAGAQQAVTDLTAAGAGQTGQLTTTGQKVAKQAAADVLAGVTPPGPTDPIGVTGGGITTTEPLIGDHHPPDDEPRGSQ
jgi:hypothetical protein